MKALERFRRMVRKDASGCWVWLGARTAGGYGKFCADGKDYLAHRFSVAFLGGADLLQGAVVLHKCHKRSCVNPRHLRVGTHAENMRDMAAAGRCARQHGPRPFTRGEFNGKAKLTAKEVARLRALYRKGKHSRNELARRFGLSWSSADRIVRGVGRPFDGRPDLCTAERKRLYKSKLRPHDVRKIRRRIASGESQGAVARAFGVHQVAVWKIVHGETWRHVK